MNNIKKITNHIQIFKDHYLIDKWSTVKIAKQYHVTPIIVSKILRNSGIIIPKNKNSGRKRVYNINHNYFKIIDTKEKAYILGFIYADGYITDTNKLGISLNIKDEIILKNIKNELKSEYPLHYFKSSYSKNYKPTKKVRFLINSVDIYNDLKELGCLENKSDILKFPIKKIPQYLISHFIRGYFDGDGSIYNSIKYKNNNVHCYPGFSFIGTNEFLTEVIKNLPFKTKAKLYKEKRTDKNVWEFKTTGIKRSKIFYTWLYKNANLYLPRKKNKFEELLKIDVQRL